MDDKKLLKTGVASTIILAICCFTPALVWLMGGLGLAAYVSGLDAILLPLLGLSLIVTVIALMRRHKNSGTSS